VRRGTSARVESACGGTGGSDANNGPSTPGAGPSSVHLADCPRVRRGLPAGGSRSRGDKSITLPCSSQTARAFLHISLSLSLPLSQGRTPSWGFCLGHSPNCLSTSPDSPRGSPPYHPGVFSHISFSLSDFEQEGDYGLMMRSKIRLRIQVFELVNVFGILSWCYGNNLVNQYLVFMELQGLQNRILLFTVAPARTGRTVRRLLADGPHGPGSHTCV
jgi:hypothetical protein